MEAQKIENGIYEIIMYNITHILVYLGIIELTIAKLSKCHFQDIRNSQGICSELGLECDLEHRLLEFPPFGLNQL